MSDRRLALTVSFSNVGQGTVIRNAPSASLAPPNTTGILTPAPSPQTTNVSLFEGVARRRPGYSLFSSAKADASINSVYAAAFNDTSRRLVRGYADTTSSGGGVEQYLETTDKWVELLPAVGAESNGLITQPWQFAMVPVLDIDSTYPNAMIFGNAGSEIFLWRGQTGSNSGFSISDNELVNFGITRVPKNPHVLFSYLSRAMAFNVTTAEGDTASSRLVWSAVGNAADWQSLSAGDVDLSDDPYPGANAVIMGGRLVLFKGGKDGGAIYVATPTPGDVSNPMRFDSINAGTDIGPIIPRSVVLITPNMAFFLGHDAVYIYDGVRALLPFAESVARDITSRLTMNALDTGFAYYDMERREVQLHVAVDGAITPNETWVFDIRTQRAYGPFEYGTSMLDAVRWVSQGTLQWDSFGQDTGRTWDTLLESDAGQEFYQWDNINSDPARSLDAYNVTTIYGGNDGQVYQSTSDDSNDAGTAIACTYVTPALTPKDWVSQLNTQPNPAARRWIEDDMYTLRSIRLRHESATDWVPIVEVTTDGTTWTLVSDGTTASATGGRRVPKIYDIHGQVDPAVWYQFRVRNTNGDAFTLTDFTAELTYAGSARHE